MSQITREEFQEIADEYSCALRIVEANLNTLQQTIPGIDSVETRIKTYESTLEKCSRKNITQDAAEIKHVIKDIAGARITCQFRDDIFKIVEILHGLPGIAVNNEKDYLSNPKPNGYSSYHICTFVQAYIPGKGTRSIPVEIQVRTMAQNLWASAEHVIRYKSAQIEEKPEVTEKFAKIAELLRQIDEQLIELRNYSEQIRK